MEGSSPCIDATTTLFYRDKIAALHPAMFEPFHPKPATEDQLLEALKSILVEAEDYPGGLIAGLKSADFRIEALARVRIHQLSKNLEDIVVNDSRFLGDAVRAVMSGEFKGGFYPMFFAEKLVTRLLELDSPEGAIQWLTKVLHTPEADGQMVTLIRGAPVTTSFDLFPRFRLVPVADLPDSRQKLSQTTFFPHSIGTSVLSQEVPSSALVVLYPKQPFLVELEHPVPPQYAEDVEHIEDAILALTIVGPRIVLRAGSWFNLDDPDLEAASHSVISEPILELIPQRWLESVQPLEAETARRAVEAFMSLHGSVKDKVRIALSRLKLALCRHSVGDKALELAIAFETLLEDGGNSEMTHKIKVRTARLIGGSVAERERNAAIVGKTYEVRSALVHKGQVDSSKLHKLRSGEDKVSAEKVVALAIDVCAKLIWEILRRQDIPDWAHFDIVEHSEPDGGLDRASEATHRAADSGE